jgi:hypothetical protein
MSFIPFGYYRGVSPADVEGLIVWFDAQEGITESSGDISQWADQSGNGFFATQSTAANQPTLNTNVSEINGYNSVRFTNTNVEYMNIVDSGGTAKPWQNGGINNSHTMFVVTNQKSSTGGHYGVYITQGANARRSVGWGPQTYPDAYISFGADNYAAGGLKISGSSAGLFDLDQWYTAMISWTDWQAAQANADSGSFRVNGTSYTSETWGGAPGTPTTDNPRLGAFYDLLPQACLNAEVAELLVYTGSLATSDIEDIETYLRTKYGHY